MATLRNLAISTHRLTGATNIAAACRDVSRHPIASCAWSYNSQINFAEALTPDDTPIRGRLPRFVA